MTKNYKLNYFKWLCNTGGMKHNGEYSKMLQLLHTIDFYHIIPLDDTHYSHVHMARQQYCEDKKVPYEEIKDIRVSILEVLILMLYRFENTVLSYDHFSITRDLFKDILKYTNLDSMKNSNFDRVECSQIILNLLNRKYDYYGNNGAIFVVNKPYGDMRSASLWYQLNWYSCEKYNISAA